ncbi:hypothetical protein SAMN04487890_11212 [Mucilaginibacter polytrichastri]|nr:hypothetical protein SAMN04487890_11212 [Mucilaginibacter polytrichastri]
MNSSYIDMKINDNIYFVKSFGLSDSSYLIHWNRYWKIKSGNAFFYLSGFIREKKSTILFIPEAYRNNLFNISEFKLFDFNAKANDSWKIIYDKDNEKSIRGDSITFIGKKVIKNDTLYRFSMVKFSFNSEKHKNNYAGNTLFLEVSKQNGIVKITKYDLLQRIDCQAILYPKERFVNNINPNSLEL